MAAVSPRLRSALLRQLSEMYAETDLPWQDFEQRAVLQLALDNADHASRFALRICWLDAAVADFFDWESFGSRYAAAVATYRQILAALEEEAPKWAPKPLQEHTLAILQSRQVQMISARSAGRALESVGRLADAIGAVE